MITQVTCQILQTVSSEIMSISRIKDNNKKMKNKKTTTLYHLFLLKITKESIFVELPYCPQNELVVKWFLPKIYQITNQNFQATIKCITKKAKRLFSLKDKNPYPACQIYKGTRVCDETYIAETIRNVEFWWNEHENKRKESEAVKHLRKNLNHKFNWETLLQAFKSYEQRKYQEVFLYLLWEQHWTINETRKSFIYFVMVSLENFSTYCKLCKCFFFSFIDFLSFIWFLVYLCNYHNFN